MMQWFRHYHGAASDPKFGGIARKTGQTRERVFFVWIMLLESASSSADRGAPTVTVDDIADVLNCDAQDVNSIVTGMAERGMIDGKGRIAKWDERQPERDDSAKRMREKRNRDKALSRRDGTVTRGDGTVTRQDLDTDTERKNKNTVETDLGADAPPPLEDGFGEFWEAYPKRQGADPRKVALSRYRSARKAGAKAADLLAGAKALAAKHKSDTGAERQFIPRASTWLSEERWKDAALPCEAGRAVTEIDRVAGWLRGERWPESAGPPPSSAEYRGDLRAAVKLLDNRFAKGRLADRCNWLRQNARLRLGETA
jgi:hypothetical protein